MSFVGNEYWAGSTTTSSDPAAASCTQVSIIQIKMVMKIKIMKETLYENSKIPELLNPWVNSVFCGANSRVVTKEGKLITLKEYQEEI